MSEEKVTQEEKLTFEESEYQAKVMFEDDAEVKLRDGKTYKVMPLGLMDGRTFMKKLKSINTEIIMLNLMEDMEGNSAEDDLYDVLLLAFKYNPLYDFVDKDYLGRYCDVVIAKKIIEIMLGLNEITPPKR